VRVAAQETTPVLDRFKPKVDRILDFLRANPKADWEALRKRIEPVAVELEETEITREDLKALQRYIEERGKDLQPRIKALRKDMQASEGERSLARSIDTGDGTTCYTYCLAFLQIECGTDRLFGICLGGWQCVDQMGGHLCLETAGGDVPKASTCKNDSECPPGYRCATWTFKKNECLYECKSDSDCDPGEKCKKPLGTSFKRCK
jgi:hypothetical protein